MTHIAMESGLEIDGLPGFTKLKNGGSFHGYVSHNQKVLHDKKLSCLN